MVLALILVSISGFADEGVLIQYVLTEKASKEDITTSDFGFLVHFDKHATMEMGGTARLEVSATDNGDSVTIELKLYDYTSSGALIHIGNTTVEAPFGKESHIEWPSIRGIEYSLSVNPKRHNILG